MQRQLAINGGHRVIPEGLTRLWPRITDAERIAVLRVLDSGVLVAFRSRGTATIYAALRPTTENRTPRSI